MKTTSKKKGDNSKIEKIHKKIEYYKHILLEIICSVNKFKDTEIFSASEYYLCIEKLNKLRLKIENIGFSLVQETNITNAVNDLQKVNDDLCVIMRLYGSSNCKDIIDIAFGQKYLETELNNEELESKFTLINNYSTPIGYKMLKWKSSDRKSDVLVSKINNKSSIIDDLKIVNDSITLDCFDLGRSSSNFHCKVYGIKVAFHNTDARKTLLIHTIINDVIPQFITNKFLEQTIENFKMNVPDPEVNTNFALKEFTEYSRSLTLKDYVVFSNSELYNKYAGLLTLNDVMKKKSIQTNVKNFLGDSLYLQRSTIMQLLLKKNDPEFYYLAYLLYDLLSNDMNNSVDTQEQKQLYDSLPWYSKKKFKEAMSTTSDYTRYLSNFDSNKIPLEQQICLMKVDDSVKEKAMVKLKEIKAKSEDSGGKARQYLEGLLKIPFGVYKEEPILRTMKDINKELSTVFSKLSNEFDIEYIPNKETYSIIEIRKILDTIHTNNSTQQIVDNEIVNIKHSLTNGKNQLLKSNISKINAFIKQHNLFQRKLVSSGKKHEILVEQIHKFIDTYKNEPQLFEAFVDEFIPTSSYTNIKGITQSLESNRNNLELLNNDIGGVREILDQSVHGHKHAKQQIERIIGQWINGEQTGYCFGFEGPPGVGKTSIAKKGLSCVLKDEKGDNRPFGFIAIGGSSNGSILSGHSYTYVGSTWGRICDILMETKCMNPIIFIDELDKVSRTEHGKEIIGVLTHLVDTTQNDGFQDKYFNGIDIDLSKALFIFSYNDVSAIDKILLDRIHRIKFENLQLDEKITIAHKYLLPEMFERVNIHYGMKFTDEVLTFIIERYTNEPGVRKFKQLLFEIISDINLKALKDELDTSVLPIVPSIDDIKNIYLKERDPMLLRKIHTQATTGVINGLWANSMGQGGVIPIQSSFFPSSSLFDLKLTGMQGDVMKESMNVAKTIAFQHTPHDTIQKLIEDTKDSKMNGIHIHCPEGAVPKDGPSAGTAITVTLISLLNNRPIKANIAITGEINLRQKVTAIGGLDLKILGGIKAGVNTFIYPEENTRDFDKFYEQYKENPVLDGITFHCVSDLHEVLELVFEE